MCISLLKGSNETVEATSLTKRAWANIYIAISLYFRLFSILYNIIYFEYLSVGFIFLLFVTNYLVLLYHNETNRKWASTIASLFVSIFLPVCIARDPERYQIKERNENSNETADQHIMTEHEENSKQLAFWLSIFANPICLLADASVFFCVKYTDYKHATIWSDGQLEQSFTLFLLPLFFISMLASFAYSPYLEKESDPHRNIWDPTKKLLAIISLIGIVIVGIVFGLFVERLERYSLVFVNGNNELSLVEVVSKGQLPEFKINGEGIRECKNMKYFISDYRKGILENVGYLDGSIDKELAFIESKKTSFYYFADIPVWNQAPLDLIQTNPHCKKCLVSSILCN